MNQTRIDKIGVSAVINYFCRMGYIDPHINFDDKVPVWDGTIDVHKSADSNAKHDIEFNLYVQVKSSIHESNNFNAETSHLIDVNDLKLYLKQRGTLLIKVLINKHKAQLYFAYLNKVKLKQLIEKCNETQEKKTVKLNKAPKEFRDLIPHLRTMHLQGNHSIIKMDTLLKNENFTMKITTAIPKNENPLVWLASHPSDILLNIPGFEESFYLENGPSYITTKTIVKQPVSANGIQFYTEFSIETQKYGLNLQIGDSFRIEHTEPVKDNKMAQVKITPNASDVNAHIKELEFILAINDTKSFFLAEQEFKCPKFNLSPKDKENIQRDLLFSKLLVSLYNKLGMPLTIDRQKLAPKEWEYLEMLVNGLLRNLSIKNKKITDFVHVFQIAGSDIVVGINRITDADTMLINISDCRCFRQSENKNCNIEYPILSYCLAKDKLGDNLDYFHPEIIYDKLYKKQKNETFLSWANIDVLAFIMKYDSTHTQKYLTCASQICHWLLNKANDLNINTDFYFLNLMQIKVRQELKYSKEDILRLNTLAVMQDEKGFGANVVLNNLSESSKIWDSLSEGTKSSLREFPIYTLYTKLN